MINTKLKSIKEIKVYNTEILDKLEVIDCEWFQNKVLSYECLHILAFLLPLKKLKDIHSYTDIKMISPDCATDFRRLCEKNWNPPPYEWETVCRYLQIFRYFTDATKNRIDLWHLIKLLGLIVFIDNEEHFTKFIEQYQQPECQQIIKDLLNSGQLRFTADGILDCCENHFEEFNKIPLEGVIKSTDTQKIKMDVF